MKRVARRSSAALVVGVLALAPGCSLVAGHSNAGIPFLEEANAAVAQVSTWAKVVGWVLAGPLDLLLVPPAVLAWATPWVDLPVAVDIASAPSVVCGYLFQAIFGAPTYAALGWIDDDDGSDGREQEVDLEPKGLVPWGFVVDHRPADPSPREPLPVPEATQAYYAVPEGAAERLREAVSREAPGADPVRLPLAPGLSLEYYRAERDLPRPLVLMTPPSAATFAARYLAERYARAGVHAAVIVPDGVLLEPGLTALQVEERLRAAVVWARVVVSALAPLPEVTDVRFLGVSAGGIFGAILMGLEPRIERAVLVLPGGDLASLVEISDEESVTAYRKSRRRAGVGARQLSEEFARVIRTEPLRLAKHVDPRRLELFLGAEDTAVPIAGGLALRDALGRPETWVLAGNHETAALCFGFVLREIDAFLLGGPVTRARLAARSPTPRPGRGARQGH